MKKKLCLPEYRLVLNEQGVEGRDIINRLGFIRFFAKLHY